MGKPESQKLNEADITRLLSEQNRSPQAGELLLALVRENLRRRAEYHLRVSTAKQTLDPTALVHEAYLRLFGSNGPRDWQNRAHFFMAASRAMQDILVERARRATRLKRGGGRQTVPLEQNQSSVAEAKTYLDLHDALKKLESISELRASIIRLKFFCGISLEEIALALGVSRSTAWREWSLAKVWLAATLSPDS